jgi:hypothetical protein
MTLKPPSDPPFDPPSNSPSGPLPDPSAAPSEYYRAALDAASREYEELSRQRREIDNRLSQLAQTMGTLNRLCGFTANVFWGLTDACRVVLRGAGHPMTPLEVRDRLEAMGFDLSKYTSSLAAIHTVLKRLQDARELRFVELDSGKFAYEWQQAPARGAIAVNESKLSELVREGDLKHLEPGVVPGAKKRRKK